MDIIPTLPGGPLGTVTGILLILLGILALLFPALVFSLIVVFFVVFALIVSVELVRAGISGSTTTPSARTLQVIAGLAGIVLAIAILVIPYFMTIAVRDIFAVWAILSGLGNLLAVIATDSGTDRLVSILTGIVLAVTGLFILLAPAMLADFLLVVILGIISIILGIFSIWFARAEPVPGEGVINRSIYK
jgi:uncharacterized membrane protein HdeD (DUF308 family)